jgi:hypothetical protein
MVIKQTSSKDMDIHKLYIFAKNRDAIAAQKGYSFQQLTTIRDWLSVRVAGGKQVIYCDYEDDIFLRDHTQSKATFKQIKLYSTNFSFASESITNSIAHFFMLYVKGDYAFDQTTFEFETNASIVGKNVKDNDALLLKEWYENQDALTDELITKIRKRVKKILDEYVNVRYEELSSDVDQKSNVQKAKLVYETLMDDDIDAFIRCIHWRFYNVDQNTAVDRVVAEVESLVMQVPLPLNENRSKIYTALLIAEVHRRSIQDNPDDRKLTNELLDSILLSAGSKEDIWYAEAVRHTRQSSTVEKFFPGEFQNAIAATRYCRWKNLDDRHKSVWQKLLEQYIALADIPIKSKKKAIYEYLFLKIGHNYLEKLPASAIAGDVDLIRFYIENWKTRNHIRDVDEDIALIQLLKAQVQRYSFPVSKEDLMAWEKEIETFLEDEMAKQENVDRQCELLELRGHLEKQKDVLERVKNVGSAFEIYRKILPLLPQTKFYSLSKLYSQLDSLQELLIEYDLNEELQDTIEGFQSEIQQHASKTGQRITSAYALIEKAERHFKNRNLRGYLKALDLFHQAKALCRMDDTKAQYNVCLLNLSQVYGALGMTYVAKYYALIALWSTWHSVDPNLNKLLPKALSLICLNDFLSGSWMSAITDFGLYLFLQREFDEKGLSFQNDNIFLATRHNIALVLTVAPTLQPEMKDVADSRQKIWGTIWDEQIQPFIDEFNKGEKPIERVKKMATGMPLMDLGGSRVISFNALQIDWRIEFENNAMMVAISEEFVSFLQAALCEIAAEDPNILLADHKVSILIHEGHFQKEFTDDGKWILTIPVFDSNEEENVRSHYMYLGVLMTNVLSKVTYLTKEELNKFYFHLLEKRKLGEKLLEGTAYQRCYKQSLDSSLIDILRGSDFKPLAESSHITIERKWLV